MEKIGIVIGPIGRGTNMRAIIEACEKGLIPAQVSLVVTPNQLNPAAQFAISKQIQVIEIKPGVDYETNIQKALCPCSMVCLAGYMRLLPSKVLKDHPGRVLNIHPALLPKFGGKGMYGLHVHQAVLNAHESESGCTVHTVTEVYDEGEILIQMSCPVFVDDTPETLAARVLELEVRAYPEAILKVLDGKAS